jgi:hypothetical protein
VSGADSLGVDFAPALKASTTSTRRGHSLKVSISVKPGSAASRRTARLQVREHGSWVNDRTVRLSSSGTATIYESLRTAGTRMIRLRLTSGKGYGTGYSGGLTLRWR